MANTAVSTILTDVKRDIKEDTTSTTRDNELIGYINQFCINILTPLLAEFSSDYGMSEWITTETVANVREVQLPSGFLTMEALYLIKTEHSGTATSGSATSVVLDSDASDEDDTYNTFILRTTGGTGDGQQFTITDYDGDTLTATVDSTIATGFSTDTTFIIYQEPTEDNRLAQVDIQKLRENYTGLGIPEAYALIQPSSEVSYMILGNIPNDIYALHGWYYATPSKATATTSYLPYQPIFDDVVRQYVTFRAFNRDEYNTQVELALLEQIREAVITIILGRGYTDQNSIPLRGAGG